MITTIISNTPMSVMIDACEWVSDQLHVPRGTVTPVVAVAYIVKHFEQGAYSGWDGWTEMREADAR